jgi:hypothetical protein
MKYLLPGAITEAGQQLQAPDFETWMAEIGRSPSQPVDRLAPCGRGDPAAGIRRDAVGPPVLKRLYERVPDQFLCESHIAEAGCQPGMDAGGILAVCMLKLVGQVHISQSPSTSGLG